MRFNDAKTEWNEKRRDNRSEFTFTTTTTNLTAGFFVEKLTVAFDFGYSREGSFSTLFNKWLGQTPSSFMQRIVE